MNDILQNKIRDLSLTQVTKVGVLIRSSFSVFGQNRDRNRGTPVFGFGKPEPGTGFQLTGVPVTGRFRFLPDPVTNIFKKLFFFLKPHEKKKEGK